ncbi:MAG: hypothetical protein JF616_21745 [Fibrobacteres bacterium]|nr:hypothetical protein [Fibrobacterota bacterium]
MKKKMGLEAMAQYAYSGLKKAGIDVTLSGGACVSIYTDNAYQSGDLDFIRQLHDGFEKVSSVMEGLGFEREGRHFTHPDSGFFVEFPPPPISVGNEPPRSIVENVLKTDLGEMPVKMLSPTDCVKDRLCGYFYWNDLQCLEQAMMVAVARGEDLDMKELKRWARQGGMLERFSTFQERLRKQQPGKGRKRGK